MHVRHERRDLLEKIVDLPLQLVQKLQNAINLDVFTNHHQGTIFGKKSSYLVTNQMSPFCAIYVGSISNDKYV